MIFTYLCKRAKYNEVAEYCDVNLKKILVKKTLDEPDLYSCFIKSPIPQKSITESNLNATLKIDSFHGNALIKFKVDYTIVFVMVVLLPTVVGTIGFLAAHTLYYGIHASIFSLILFFIFFQKTSSEVNKIAIKMEKKILALRKV